jgi:hypothetical protein
LIYTCIFEGLLWFLRRGSYNPLKMKCYSTFPMILNRDTRDTKLMQYLNYTIPNCFNFVFGYRYVLFISRNDSEYICLTKIFQFIVILCMYFILRLYQKYHA